MNGRLTLSTKDIRTRIWVSVLTLVLGVVVLVIKFWAYRITHSHAIYSDAMESIVNVLTAAMGIIVVSFSAMPADEEHPYGHGKAEHLSAAFEGGLISFAAVLVIYQAVKAYLVDETLHEMNIGMLIIAATGVANLFFGLFLKRVGRRSASPALTASGVHLITDFWTTLGAILALVLVKVTGAMIWDQIIAILLGLHMGRMGIQLVRESASELLDSEDTKILERLAEIFEKYASNGIIQIHHTKVIRAGWFHHIDAHVVVPEFWSVKEAHQHIDKFENAVITEYEFSGEANFHLDPCRKNYCSACDYSDCRIRMAPFKKRIPVVLEHLRSKTEPEQYRKD